MAGTVAAVIVTFNRSEKLSKVLDTVIAQQGGPDIIYVIDNASTDDTREIVESKDDPRVKYQRLPQNVGGAGGFHEGMKLAHKAGADYQWIMDDDAYPEPDALDKLVSAIETFEEKFVWKPSFACSRVNWIDGSLCEMNTPSTVWDWPRFYSPETPWFLVGSCSFVSVLVPRRSIDQHGLPIRDYFIWYDDAEFTQRVAKTYPGIFVQESVVTHDTPENKGVNYALINDKNIWKFRYGVRNETHYRRREQGAYGVAVMLRRILTEMSQGKVPWKLRWQIIKGWARGLVYKPQIVKL
ncbi:glycosyltransferase family 2 protein [Paracoccaceae bacterium GXU_MW_L88]